VVQIGNDPVRIEILHERVKQALLTRQDKAIFLRADAAATVQDVTTVFERLKVAGVEKIGFMTQPAPR
jgi:biopolymer transport protein ExbD